MSATVVIVLAMIVLAGWGVLSQRAGAGREMSRFQPEKTDFFSELGESFNALASGFAENKKRKTTVGYQASKSQREREQQYEDAGLESASERGKFILFRTLSYVAGPLIGALAYLYVIPYYATIITLVCTAAGILLPMMWLKKRATNRTESIQRELPLVLDLTNLGTSAGWDVASALERVTDVLHEEFPNHPLIKEFKKAAWLANSGYTWAEALKRVGVKLNDDTVRRTALALAQAMNQGGDRTSQLDGIAEDAQRIYNASLDKRLAALPVKALLVTMLLMIAYFIILLAPAAVQVKNIME